jgi:hypothetical protein
MSAVTEFETQGKLEAGTEGWWQVWGASPHHIKGGDIILTKGSGDDIDTLYVEDTFTAKAAPMRVGIVINGNKETLGALCPIILLRRGTHNTLAE